MIPLLIAAGIVGAGIGAVVALNWDEIKEWLSDIINKIKTYWRRYKPLAKKVASVIAEKYIKNGHPVIRIMYRLFYREDNSNKWNELEDLPTREVNEEELPPSIRAKMRRAEQVDITDDMQRELKLEI